MYNGIGLVTPRGSGTNGYVVRNLSHLRPRDMQQDAHKFDQGPPKHREPDAGILEHERLRKVEIACLELQLELEDNNIPEEDIEREVSKLREKLTATITSALPTSAKNIKASDTHGLAAAKKEELSKMARALGTSANYVEGDAFNREKQEELRHQRAAEREEKDRRRDEMRLKREEDSKRWEAEHVRRTKHAENVRLACRLRNRVADETATLTDALHHHATTLLAVVIVVPLAGVPHLHILGGPTLQGDHAHLHHDVALSVRLLEKTRRLQGALFGLPRPGVTVILGLHHRPGVNRPLRLHGTIATPRASG
ncbi:RNA-splicing factor [Ceratobasidium sp. 395]|nr:RNA-splicing factor [Ceratobasidium sp. 395]